MQAWLRQEGLQDLVSTFTTHNIDGAELSRLSKETAAELGIGEAKKHTTQSRTRAHACRDAAFSICADFMFDPEAQSAGSNRKA